MKSHTLRISAKEKAIFDAIKSGEKSVETRAATPKNARIMAGDELVFSCSGKKLAKSVASAKIYPSIAALVRAHKPGTIVPGAKTAKDLEKVVYSFPGYEEKIREHGIIAFVLE